MKIATMPPPHAASVVLAATRPGARGLGRKSPEKDRALPPAARGGGGVARPRAEAPEAHRRRRAAGFDPAPAKPQDDPADHAHDQVVRQHRAAAVTLELAP